MKVCNDKNSSVEKKSTANRHLHYIRTNIYNLRLIAHNGSRFDLPAMQNELFSVVDPQTVKAIRKGCSFISLMTENLTFLDSMHFVPSMSLQSFCKTFDVEVPKGIWPYEYFKNIDEIYNCTEYPPISAFYSSLRKIGNNVIKDQWENLSANFVSAEEKLQFFGLESFDAEKIYISPKDYYEAKNEFQDKTMMGEWRSMLCVLEDYNIKDCKILYMAMTNFISMVRLAFNADVLTKMTLPGLAEG